MAKKNRLTEVGKKVGAALGKATVKAHIKVRKVSAASKIAKDELKDISKRVRRAEEATGENRQAPEVCPGLISPGRFLTLHARIKKFGADAEELLQELQRYAAAAPTAKAVMQIAKRLHENMARYNWVGFYLVESSGRRLPDRRPIRRQFHTQRTHPPLVVDSAAPRPAAAR